MTKGNEVDKSKYESNRDLVLAEYKKGNVVYMGIDTPCVCPLKDFIKQPAEGILYDLNRLECVVITFIKDPKWVNDYAVATVIRELKDELSREQTLSYAFQLEIKRLKKIIKDMK